MHVPRASASAVAFGIGLFSGKGSLGPGEHRAFSVISESRASDIYLRFFDACETYKKYRENQEPVIDKLKEPILDEIASEQVRRHQLSFSRQDIASLWFLCKQEASLLDIIDQACSLFNASEETRPQELLRRQDSVLLMLRLLHHSPVFLVSFLKNLGCGNTDFCPYEVFKEQIVNPHLKHDFGSICNVKLETPKTKLDTSDSECPACKL